MAIGADEVWPAPAKLNLMLRIVGQREDGYHLLQSVFQFLDYGDQLCFFPRDDREIRLRYALPAVEPEQDLCYRAARLLQQQGGIQQGVEIALEKRLPMGGGLGGGSSDAATTLVALNRIWGLDFSLDELAAFGLSLGADVPVFVRGRAAWAESIGEQLQPFDPPTPWYLVLQPVCQVATAAVFSEPKLTRQAKLVTIRDFFEGVHDNSCEPVVRKAYPEVDAAMRWLADHAEARLTGTGACVFAEMATEAVARSLLARSPYEGFVARGINRSPLLDKSGLA